MAQQVQGQFGYQTVQLIKTKPLGTGSYGAVYEAKRDDLPCAAKILHPTLFQFNDPGAMTAVRRFEQECCFLRAVSHPNVVQYLGSYRDPETELPVLLMELMDESLTRFLERSKEPLPYHTQLDLCHDIALALAYLHSNDIIHRDLSSNNVLLIGSRRAKLTDFGMMKLFNVSTATNQLTMCPGAQVYMSPEALDDPPVYTNKLDCFSLGVLAIQIITRQFPDPGPCTTKVQDPRSPTGKTGMPVLETERRKSHTNLISPTHPLLPIATACLSYSEDDRPSAQELCHCLAALKEAPQYYSVTADREGRERLIRGLQQEKEELQQQQEECDRKIRDLQQQVKDYQAHLREKDAAVGARQQENQELREAIRNLRHELQDSRTANCKPLRQPAVEQPCKATTPCMMFRGSAAVQGDVAYFRSYRSRQVQLYNSATEEWSTLPECPTECFTLAVVNGLVTAVGGRQPDGDPTNTLLSLVEKKWEERFPRMLSKRRNPAVVCSGNALVAAGGTGDGNTELATVEILKIDAFHSHWSTACSLPHPLTEASATVCGDSVYLVGGRDQHNMPTKSVVSCSLSALLQSRTMGVVTSQAENHQIWRTIADLPVFRSTCITLNGQLLTVGGENLSGTSDVVYGYDQVTDSWKVVSHMAVPRSDCLVAILPGNQLNVVGGTKGLNNGEIVKI